MKALTGKQKEVLNFITQRVKEGRPAPSLREIGKHVGGRSVATVSLHVRALVRKGHLDREKWRARGLVPKGLAAPAPGATAPIPLLSGFVSAGPTQEICEDVDRVIHIDRYLVRSKDCFAMRVKGTSMTGAGIEESDVVIVRRQETAERGELVIALKDGEATLKRYMPRKGGVTLKAANPKAQSFFIPFCPDAQTVCGIVGKVIKVVKDVGP